MRRAESRLKGLNRSSTTPVFMLREVLNFDATCERRVSAGLSRRRPARVPNRNTAFLDETVEAGSGRAHGRGPPIAPPLVRQRADPRPEIFAQVLPPARARECARHRPGRPDTPSAGTSPAP